MNKEYLANYGGPGISYEQCWREFTVLPNDLAKALRVKKFNIQSVIDFGAADGRWLQEFRDAYALENLRMKGIELVEDYFAAAPEFVEQGSIQEWKSEKFDLAFITALAYLERVEVERFMNKLSASCSYLVPHMEFWDSWRFRKDELSKPEEKTLWCVSDWDRFFSNYGWERVYSDYFYIYKNTGKKPRNARKFLFEYVDECSLKYEKLQLSYNDEGYLIIKGKPTIPQTHLILEEFVAKRFCFESKPPVCSWTLENGLWCSKVYEIY